MKSTMIIVLGVIVIACNSSNTKVVKGCSSRVIVASGKSIGQSFKKNQVIISEQKKLAILASNNLVDVQSLDASIHVDLKYATTDNFMKMKLYDVLNAAYLQKDVAERIVLCQAYLETLYPEYSLLIYDAVRPISVQQKMWNALDSIPTSERGKFVSNPSHRSMHNYGAAIDVTIVDKNGNPLDMGAGYDDIRRIAYPSLENAYLKSGELTEIQVEHRKLLRKVMTSQHFRNIPTEWWHFNACSKEEARLKYELMFTEPN